VLLAEIEEIILDLPETNTDSNNGADDGINENENNAE
jgi:hypothetical protein